MRPDGSIRHLRAANMPSRHTARDTTELGRLGLQALECARHQQRRHVQLERSALEQAPRRDERAMTLDELPSALTGADLVISCTGAVRPVFSAAATYYDEQLVGLTWDLQWAGQPPRFAEGARSDIDRLGQDIAVVGGGTLDGRPAGGEHDPLGWAIRHLVREIDLSKFPNPKGTGRNRIFSILQFNRHRCPARWECRRYSGNW